MSLLAEAMESCTKLTKTSEADGYGGYSVSWTDGDSFEAAIVLAGSSAGQEGAAADAENRYTVTTQKSVTLNFHDVFRREADEKLFLVVSDGDANHTPASAFLDMRQVEAEEWEGEDE